MTKEEIMSRAQFLNVKDMMILFACGRDTAYKRLREIKSVSDILHVRGKVTLTDYEAWYNRPIAKQEADKQ